MSHASNDMVERIEAALTQPRLLRSFVQIVVLVYVFPVSDKHQRALMLRGSPMLRHMDDEKVRELQEEYFGRAFDAVRRALQTHGLELEHLVRYRMQSEYLQRMRPDSRPLQCAACGEDLGMPSETGRPRMYCDRSCRQAAYRRRAASTSSLV